MRPLPGKVSFLFGLLSLHCSVFPEHAPTVGPGAGGRAGTGGAGHAGTGAGGADAKAGTTGSGGESTGGTSGNGGTPDAGDASAPDADAALDASTRTVAYVASIADCVEAVVAPQPGSCLSFSTLNDGPNELWVDVRRTGRRAFTTYLQFRIDGAIANHVVDSVELRVTVTIHRNAPGTGADVWEVVPFDADSLYLQAPAVVGSAALAQTPGPAASGQTVIYALPVSVAKPDTSLHLSLTLAPSGDGTGYWGTNGDPQVQAPPTLVVKYR